MVKSTINARPALSSRTQIRQDMAFRINGEDSMKEWEHTGRYYRPL